MRTAFDAKEKTTEVLENCATQELKEIESKIESAVRSGKYSISDGGSLSAQTYNRLKKLGYKVETGSQYNESYYIISWS